MAETDEVRRFCLEQHPRLIGVLVMYTGDQHLAEELAQEALTVAVRDWRRLRRLASPGGYVQRVAINLANARFRRARISRRALTRLAGGIPEPVDEPDPAEIIDVRNAVASLPPRRRAVVVLRYQGGLSLDEIADTLGIATGTVKSQLNRALATLREALTTEENEHVN